MADMQCPRCGGNIIGDGHTTAMQCENADEADTLFREADAPAVLCRTESAEVLYEALQQALTLNRCYAKLLNQHDGGERNPDVFVSPETWIARLREIGELTKLAGG